MLSFPQQYQHKLKTASELATLLGVRPRAATVILCHGVFDIVHPGHLRHLLYAKSKAAIQVCSVTADRWITKGIYRPHVPAEIRALNLAALECCDYVVITDAPDALGLIGMLQPDYFAKGYEYSNAKNALTLAESRAVAAYGGELLFSPGDLIYSSSALLAGSVPDLGIEKLQLLMHRYGIGFADLAHVLDGLTISCYVLGDTIVDSYTHCALIGASGKTPTISALYQRRVDYLGGAAIVALHMAAAGARVTYATVLGDDVHGQYVLDELKHSSVICEPVIDITRPTTNKNAILVDDYRMLKVDTLDNSSISDHSLGMLVDNLRAAESTCVVFSDFRHGIFNSRTIPQLCAAIPRGAFSAADSQVASRWGNCLDFKGFSLLTPNEREARFALADQDSGVRLIAGNIYERAECGSLLLKLGARGCLAHISADEWFVLDALVEEVRDPVGAGDAVLAYATLALASGAPLPCAAILGMVAAGIACEHDGNIPIGADVVRERLQRLEKRMQ